MSSTINSFVSFFLFLFAGVAFAAPQVRDVDLEAYTRLTVYVAPGAATKFIFPFVLNEEPKGALNAIPFSKMLSNNLFEDVRVSENKGADRLNSFIIICPRTTPAGAKANLFFNIAGYEGSVQLVATVDANLLHTKEGASDVRFKLTNEARELLIQDEIRQRTAQLEQEVADKKKEIDNLVDQRTLAQIGDLVLNKPETIRVKSEGRGALKNSDVVTVYVDSIHKYGRYAIIPFEMELDSRGGGASIRGAKLFAINRDTKVQRPISSGASLPDRLEPRKVTYGSLTALASTITSNEMLKLDLLVDDTPIEVKW